MKRLLVILLLLSYAQGVDARAVRDEDYGSLTPAPAEVAVPAETAAATATPVETAAPVEAVTPDEDASAAADTLKGRYRSFFPVGNVIRPGDLDTARFDLLKKHFDILTAEEAMMPLYLQSRQGVFTFEIADKLVDAALDAGLKVHGHTLAWHQQSPEWINYEGIDRGEAIFNLVDHAKTVAGHFRGRVVSWDALNEAIIDNPSNPEDWRASLRKVPWYNAIGEEYIAIVFRAAREADPDAVLYYNDYNLDSPNKALAVYNMVKEMNEKYPDVLGRPLIDGIGMQGHYSLDVNIDAVAASLKRFASLGVRVSMSELDVQAGANYRLTGEQAIRQGVVYARLFTLFRENADVLDRVTIWGLNDQASWRWITSPTLFNREQQEKPAFFGVLDPAAFLAEHESRLK